jgi:AmmeMemoRadiSam system protein A
VGYRQALAKSAIESTSIADLPPLHLLTNCRTRLKVMLSIESGCSAFNHRGVVMKSPNFTHVALSPDEGRCLIRLARMTIADRLKHPVEEEERRALQTELQNPIFAHGSGTFVTLKKEGLLRGCIGSLSSDAPLKDNVRQNALHAAFQDPRFPPLGPEEFPLIEIEVSVLTPPSRLNYDDVDALLERLRPGTDGVILRKGGASATFLPQVWKQLPRREDFLSHLCLKAGLTALAWRKGDLQVETYQVQYFEEGQ